MPVPDVVEEVFAAGGHVQCRARGGGGIARARSRLACSSGCQGKISNHLLYSKELHVDLTGQGRPGSHPEEKPPAPKRLSATEVV